MERTTQATIAEIRRSPSSGRAAKTIFFGGGTPTYLAEGQLLRILDAVFEIHPPIDGCEITSEANPGTVDMQIFATMRRGGFNRISLGAQSFVDSDLMTLGRVHRSGEIERAVGAARDAGFENLNLDLMFALPNQSVRGWKENLTRALSLAPEHLSLYCLTIEQNTAFYKQNLRGQLALPNEEAQVEMYEDCLDRTASAGYIQYEISNFAKPGHECRHNLCYWLGEEYAGYGPGAVGFIEGVRYTNLKHPEGYCAAVNEGAALAFESETIDTRLHRIERLMLGLRLNEGIDAEELEVDPKSMNKALDRGWVEFDSGRVRLTPAGRHFCSEVALELM